MQRAIHATILLTAVLLYIPRFSVGFWDRKEFLDTRIDSARANEADRWTRRIGNLDELKYAHIPMFLKFADRWTHLDTDKETLEFDEQNMKVHIPNSAEAKSVYLMVNHEHTEFQFGAVCYQRSDPPRVVHVVWFKLYDSYNGVTSEAELPDSEDVELYQCEFGPLDTETMTQPIFIILEGWRCVRSMNWRLSEDGDAPVMVYIDTDTYIGLCNYTDATYVYADERENTRFGGDIQALSFDHTNRGLNLGTRHGNFFDPIAGRTVNILTTHVPEDGSFRRMVSHHQAFDGNTFVALEAASNTRRLWRMETSDIFSEPPQPLWTGIAFSYGFNVVSFWQSMSSRSDVLVSMPPFADNNAGRLQYVRHPRHLVPFYDEMYLFLDNIEINPSGTMGWRVRLADVCCNYQHMKERLQSAGEAPPHISIRLYTLGLNYDSPLNHIRAVNWRASHTDLDAGEILLVTGSADLKVHVIPYRLYVKDPRDLFYRCLKQNGIVFPEQFGSFNQPEIDLIVDIDGTSTTYTFRKPLLRNKDEWLNEYRSFIEVTGGNSNGISPDIVVDSDTSNGEGDPIYDGLAKITFEREVVIRTLIVWAQQTVTVKDDTIVITLVDSRQRLLLTSRLPGFNHRNRPLYLASLSHIVDVRGLWISGKTAEVKVFGYGMQ